MMILYTGIAFLLLSWGTEAYMPYQKRIPNGDNVPHPCKSTGWPGVGHLNVMGTGKRNGFGWAFKAAGNKWTEELCRADSDGDGKSNGEELGDPNCTWSEGQSPDRKEGISHPGICEPVDSALCKSKNPELGCDKDENVDKCQTIKSPDTKVLDLRFPETNVPNKETNYFCMLFDLPQDKDYHIKAFDAITDNMNVLHHIIVFGCRDSNQEADTEPGLCSMGGKEECGEVIGLWSPGMDKKCFEDDIGFRFGNKSIKQVRIEMHWNNPQLLEGQTDSSGMRFWYQPSKEVVQDMVTFWTGQDVLTIPPRQDHVEFTSTCRDFCTKGMMQKPVYIVNAINHMHYLGKEQRIEVFRNGKMIKQLTNDKNWNFDEPSEETFDPPFELMPGDEIKTTCVFNSMKKDRWTYWGEGTNDEMCYGFIILYPADALPYGGYCVGSGPLTPCEMYAGTPIGDCDWASFTKLTEPPMLPMVEQVKRDCNVYGFCRPECRDISRTLREHPCLKGEAFGLVDKFLNDDFEGGRFLARIHSCSQDDKVDCSQQCSKYCDMDSKPEPKPESDWGSKPEPEPEQYEDVRDTATGNTPVAILVALACVMVAPILF